MSEHQSSPSFVGNDSIASNASAGGTRRTTTTTRVSRQSRRSNASSEEAAERKKSSISISKEDLANLSPEERAQKKKELREKVEALRAQKKKVMRDVEVKKQRVQQMQQSLVHGVEAVEKKEEQLTNTMLKKIEKLEKDKTRLTEHLEKEEVGKFKMEKRLRTMKEGNVKLKEALREEEKKMINQLQKPLEILKQQRNELEEKLSAESSSGGGATVVAQASGSLSGASVTTNWTASNTPANQSASNPESPLGIPPAGTTTASRTRKILSGEIEKLKELDEHGAPASATIPLDGGVDGQNSFNIAPSDSEVENTPRGVATTGGGTPLDSRRASSVVLGGGGDQLGPTAPMTVDGGIIQRQRSSSQRSQTGAGGGRASSRAMTPVQLTSKLLQQQQQHVGTIGTHALCASASTPARASSRRSHSVVSHDMIGPSSDFVGEAVSSPEFHGGGAPAHAQSLGGGGGSSLAMSPINHLYTRVAGGGVGGMVEQDRASSVMTQGERTATSTTVGGSFTPAASSMSAIAFSPVPHYPPVKLGGAGIDDGFNTDVATSVCSSGRSTPARFTPINVALTSSTAVTPGGHHGAQQQQQSTSSGADGSLSEDQHMVTALKREIRRLRQLQKRTQTRTAVNENKIQHLQEKVAAARADHEKELMNLTDISSRLQRTSSAAHEMSAQNEMALEWSTDRSFHGAPLSRASMASSSVAQPFGRASSTAASSTLLVTRAAAPAAASTTTSAPAFPTEGGEEAASLGIPFQPASGKPPSGGAGLHAPQARRSKEGNTSNSSLHQDPYSSSAGLAEE